jgi:hypothetical protein
MGLLGGWAFSYGRGTPVRLAVWCLISNWDEVSSKTLERRLERLVFYCRTKSARTTPYCATE